MISISIIELFLKITRTKVIGAVQVYFIRYLQALIAIVIITISTENKNKEKRNNMLRMCLVLSLDNKQKKCVSLSRCGELKRKEKKGGGSENVDISMIYMQTSKSRITLYAHS